MIESVAGKLESEESIKYIVVKWSRRYVVEYVIMVQCSFFKGEIYLMENIKTHQITYIDSTNDLQKKETKITKDIVLEAVKEVKQDRKDEETGSRKTKYD